MRVIFVLNYPFPVGGAEVHALHVPRWEHVAIRAVL
jgi:hypothetical protein